MNYKGYIIEKDIYHRGEYTVQVYGDDYWFQTVDDAKEFIDSVINEQDAEKDLFLFWEEC